MRDVSERGQSAGTTATARMMFSHLSAFLLAIKKSLSGMEIHSVKPGKPCLSKAGGGRRHGLVVHSNVSGTVNGGIALWIDLHLANRLVSRLLFKTKPPSDPDRRIALQMFYNEVTARAGGALAGQQIPVQFTVPRVFSANEWQSGDWANVAMIEVPVRTSAGDCRQAVHLRVA